MISFSFLFMRFVFVMIMPDGGRCRRFFRGTFWREPCRFDASLEISALVNWQHEFEGSHGSQDRPLPPPPKPADTVLPQTTACDGADTVRTSDASLGQSF